MAQVYSSRNDMKGLVKVFQRYAQLQPDNWKIWIELAAAQNAAGMIDQSFSSIEKAITLDKSQATRRLWQDPRFKTLRENANQTIKDRFKTLTQ